MKSAPEISRASSYGQDYAPTWVDCFGVWLSWQKIRPVFDRMGSQPRLGDFGAGYHAALTRQVLGRVSKAVVIDLQLSPGIKNHPKVQAVEGALPDALEALASESLDIIICNSVIEHLWEPQKTLDHFYRLLAPGGCCLVNVPSWRGKWFLEFSAFRLGLSPVTEMNDHKNYYDPKDLWPLLVRAGFQPSDIACGTHKFGLNTFANCRKVASN
ncbi:MAG TPA: methyltransferase domain-containing protein [Candidatus Methylacidiphilales bacterium]|nr:methyltransferase domain-containing protein [Candidatus Methylacidiphilales bacterium]